jgi:hypothetical protein
VHGTRVGPSSRPPFFWLAALLGAAALGVLLLGAIWCVRYGAFRKSAGWRAAPRAGAWIVAQVDPLGPADGRLLAGDRLLAIDGDTRAETLGPSRGLRAVAAGTTYDIRVARAGLVRDVELRMIETPRASGELGYLLSILALSFAFVATALVIAVMRPQDPIARWGAAALYVPSFTLFATAVGQFVNAMSAADFRRLLFIPIPNPFHLAVAFGFYSRFPGGLARSRLSVAVGRVFFAVGLALWTSEELVRRIVADAVPRGELFRRALPALLTFNALDSVFSLVAFTAICGTIAFRFRRVEEPDQRRRMSWIAYGSLAGLSPWLLYELVSLAASLARIESSPFLVGFNRFANLALAIVPVVTGFAIVRHRLFDIHVVVRRGVQYLLARNVLTALLALPVLGLALSIWQNRDRTLREIALHGGPYFYASIAGAALLVVRKRIRDALDRRFFREEYDRDAILVGLSRDISRLDSFSEISRHVSRELVAALHPRSVHVFQRELERTSQVLVFSSSSGDTTQAPRIADDAELLRVMESAERPRDYPFAEHELPPGEKRWLDDLGVALVVPMIGTEQRLVGLLLLGEKLSEEPYSATDRRVLQAIAGQMALCYENAVLKGRVEREQRFKHEVLSRFEDPDRLVKECPRCGRCYDGGVQRLCADDGAELAASLPIARTLVSRYRLDRLLGRGGMGAVYEATDLNLGRAVAVKVLLGHRFLNRAAVRRFEREARASAKLNHPNIISVHDFGALEGDGAFLVMELVHGVTLRRELKRLGRLDPRTAARYFRQVVEGVKAAHGAGVVHRDLKPENILIQREGGDRAIKILDFGLAKVSLLDLTDPDSLTLPGTVLGTLGYMSPEQVSGGEVDERADIFSMGVLVTEAVTGELPFRGASAREMMLATINQPFSLTGDSPEVRRLDAVLQRCLAKEPGGRFPTVAELGEELIPALLDCPPFPPKAAPPSAPDRADAHTQNLS